MSTTQTQQGTQDINGAFAFYKNLSKNGRLTFWACAAGNAMDAMDFMIFPLLIGTLMSIWKMDSATAGGIATTTLVFSALGGWIAGYVSDRIGRVPTMQLTIFLFALGSFLSAFAQDSTQLLMFRALLGLGFGGEAAVAAITLSEVVQSKDRGRAIGFFQAGYAVGWMLAITIQAFVFVWFPPEIAWRLMFAVGVLPALLIFFVRRSVEEPAVAAASRRLGEPASVKDIFVKHYRSVLAGSLLTTGAQGGFYALMTWLPQFLRTERHISVLGSTPYLFALISGCFAGYISGGWLCDKFGRRAVLIISAAAAGVAVMLYTHVFLNDTLVLALGFPLGFFAVGYYAPLMACLNELFPTRIRGSGVGFTYNIGRAVGGFFPLIVGVISAYVTLGNAISLLGVLSYTILIAQASFLSETKGLSFTAST
jgi:MFS family permease